MKPSFSSPFYVRHVKQWGAENSSKSACSILSRWGIKLDQGCWLCRDLSLLCQSWNLWAGGSTVSIGMVFKVCPPPPQLRICMYEYVNGTFIMALTPSMLTGAEMVSPVDGLISEQCIQRSCKRSEHFGSQSPGEGDYITMWNRRRWA